MFIVEMSSTGHDNDGRFGPEIDGHRVWDTFDVHEHVWKALQSLGQMYEWSPTGTVPCKELRNSDLTRSYEPNDWQYAKRVLDEDAQSWANALERALRDWPVRGFTERPTPALVIEDMTMEQYEHINSCINAELLRDFIAFLRHGSFYFGWDD